MPFHSTVKKKRQRPKPETYEEFLAHSGIRQLGLRLRVLEAQRQALGLAPWDREPLRCPQCGLFEGEADNGMLFTRRPTGSQLDTGLRFEKLVDGRFLCPSCGAGVIEPEFVIPPGFFSP